MWKGPVLPVKTNKLKIEDPIRNWNDLIKSEKVFNLEFKHEQKIKPKEIKKKSFHRNLNILYLKNLN